MTDRFDVLPTPLKGVCLLRRKPHNDDRGWLERMYDAVELSPILRDRTIAQVNQTLTRRSGTVRGMHYQLPPAAETKIITCLRGAVFDVALDLRQSSPTFLKSHSVILREGDQRSVVIGEGIAHGFQTMARDSVLLYFHTSPYNRSAERGVHPLDPTTAIAWPLAVEQISERDRSFPVIGRDFEGVAM